MDKVKIKGYRVMRFFKITGPILVRAAAAARVAWCSHLTWHTQMSALRSCA